ncbi:ABC transporter ATP-binding protein [Limoniibacter endophyticus]|uniref:ABC transporter ATP-binding protein n=1 Tax=Limoniibacter endophyticus TaxID=1565040 RepID=A0A8J3GGX0_9HYPH|nr:ABC transporter ATP-binding protein [Limoniibacter endophyticus]GHC68124.1 ABC transporter ATP-binding protein [Limoniibacter endophyticus]
MSSDEIIIEGKGLGKAYQIYAKPHDRLKQMLFRSRRFYSEYWAVQNADFVVRRGETVGIVGRNGSGKSTLLQIIAGTLQATTGSIEVKGRVAPLLELGAGFNPEFTGRENIRLSAAILGLSPDQITEREPSIVDFSGIEDFVDQPVKTYSSGMYARLAFAVAAHVDADVLIVDEILSVGDAAFTQKCMRFIRKFKEHGTILFVSHDTASVNALCDRAIWMDKGQIRAEGEAKEISLAYQAALHGDDVGGFSIQGRKREAKKPRRDLRHELIATSTHRNDIEVFAFDSEAPSYGAAQGKIVNVEFQAEDQTPLSVIEGGSEVTLVVEATALADLASPIVGFFVRDKLGQNLFGDNTYLSFAHSPLEIPAGDRFVARFSFQMPYLPTGDYAVCAALATGTQSDHVQQHWVDTAVTFRCEGGHHRQGLLGIPMHEIDLKLNDTDTAQSSAPA